MKKGLLLLSFCFVLLVPLFSFGHEHEEDVSFKAKYRKVTLNETIIKTLGLETKKIKEEVTDEIIKTTGQIEEIPSNHFDVNSPVQGKVIEIHVSLGDEVHVGQSLAILQSPEIERLQAEVTRLDAEFELAKNSYEREKSLFEKGISAKKEFQASEANLKSVEANLEAATNNLNLLSGSLIDSRQGTFALRAKKNGVITERNITIGQIVDSNQILFRGTNLSTVWASADVYEKDIDKVALGQRVHITLDGMPNKIIEGKVTYLGSLINKESRTLPVKATLANSTLKPGAFLQLHVHTGKKKRKVVIPRTALVEIDKEGTEGKHKHIVYLKKGNTFTARKVEVEEHDSNNVEVLSGLTPGETIVTQGAYQLQYSSGKDEEPKAAFYKVPPLVIVIIVFAILFTFIFLKKKKAKL